MVSRRPRRVATGGALQTQVGQTEGRSGVRGAGQSRRGRLHTRRRPASAVHAARQCAMMSFDKLVAHPETEASSTDAFRAEKASKTDPPPETLEDWRTIYAAGVVGLSHPHRGAV
jgi:hypothetical protein